MNKDKKIKFFNKRLKIILVLCLILIGALLAVKYKSSAFLNKLFIVNVEKHHIILKIVKVE